MLPKVSAFCVRPDPVVIAAAPLPWFQGPAPG
jgi:hypothetical protein